MEISLEQQILPQKKCQEQQNTDVNQQTGLLTFPIDINLVVYKSNNLLWGNVVRSGDILNSLTGEIQHLL